MTVTYPISRGFPESDSDSESSDVAPSIQFSSPPTSVSARTMSQQPSPAPSLYSLTPSLRESSYRELHERRVNNHCEIYVLPADREERLRLDNEHEMLRPLMREHYAAVAEVLTPDQGPSSVQKACIDIGCGTGRWAIETAIQFPNCDVVAVDLVPVQEGTIPPNCRYEIDDVNLGLEHFAGHFNLVHIRLLAFGIRYYYALLEQIAHALRPNGLLLLAEMDFRVYGADKKTILPAQPRWLQAVTGAARARGSSVDAGPMLPMWIRQHHAFTDVEVEDIWLPTSPPPGDSDDPEAILEKETGRKMRENLEGFVRACHPLLMEHGIFTSDQVLELEEKALAEFDELSSPTYLKLLAVRARKRPRP